MNDKRELDKTPKDFASSQVNDWCAGCGDFGVLSALEKALASLCLDPEQVAVFGGIGCSGKTPYYLKTYSVHTLHGRVLPFASGAKLANPQLTVIAVGGDGDGLSIGAGHFIAAGRRNLDLTYLLLNNGVYGLTKGQAAPTLRTDEQTRSMPTPNLQAEINPVMLAMTSGYSWIGRGYAYAVTELSQLIESAIRHRGTSFLEILQPCPTYNDLHSKDWYEQRLYSLQTEAYNPVLTMSDAENSVQQKLGQCLVRAREWGNRIATGIFLQDLRRVEYLQQYLGEHPSYLDRPACNQPVTNINEHPTHDLSGIFSELTVMPNTPGG